MLNLLPTKLELFQSFFCAILSLFYAFYNVKKATGKSIIWWYQNGPLESDD